MNDPVLGDLNADPHLAGCLVAIIPFERRKIELRVDPDTAEMSSCIQLARELVLSLKQFETKARSIAVAQLLEDYNNHWRMFSRAGPDGTTEEIAHPILTAQEFSQRLHLVALSVTGSIVEFCFGDNGLFAGHSIFVTSLDGVAFEDAQAALFG